MVNFPLCLRKGEREKESLVQAREEPLAFLFIAPRAPPHDRAAHRSCTKNDDYPDDWVEIHNTLLISEAKVVTKEAA